VVINICLCAIVITRLCRILSAAISNNNLYLYLTDIIDWANRIALHSFTITDHPTNIIMSHSPTIRPDFNFDVLYMPKTRPKLTQRSRTISIDSTSSGIDMDVPQSPSPSPTETAPYRRRSITEMLGFTFQTAKSPPIANKTDGSTNIGNDNQPNNHRVKDLLLRQQKILQDSEGFSANAFGDRK